MHSDVFRGYRKATPGCNELKEGVTEFTLCYKIQETEESEKQSDKEKTQKNTKKKSKTSSSESSEEESIDEDNEERKTETETESKVDENSDTGKAERGKRFIFRYRALLFQRNATDGQRSVLIYSCEPITF